MDKKHWCGKFTTCRSKEYYKAKAVNSCDFQLPAGYNKRIQKGELSALTGYSLWEKTAREAESKLIGLTTFHGDKIVSFTDHFVARVIGTYAKRYFKTTKTLGGPVDDVVDALINPITIVNVTRNGELRRVYIGRYSRVVITVQNSRIIQTSSRK